MKNKELYQQTKQYMPANPRQVSSTSSTNTKQSIEKHRDTSRKSASKYEHYVRNQALYQKASPSQNGHSASKQSSPSTTAGESRSQFPKLYNNLSSRAQPKAPGNFKSEQKSHIEPHSELNNSHYFKTQKHGLKSSKPSPKSVQTIEFVRSEELLNHGPDVPPPQSTFITDLARSSPNR